MFSLLSLLDDIAATLDDVAVMTKVAIKKTSALVSDDLAVNAGVVHGVNADRELPIVKAIFIGSLLNKVYCIVGVFALMAIYEPILQGVLLLGGIYLSFEGAHKVIEKFFNHGDKKEITAKVPEKIKIRGAIRTDLILSIEIIVIAKNSLTGPILNQILSLVLVGISASILIYGLVALLVKIDDFGLYLVNKDYQRFGMAFISSMPYVMKGLGIIGTLAMFLVGGGIIVHTFHIPLWMPEILQNFIAGLLAGLICVVPFEFFKNIKHH